MPRENAIVVLERAARSFDGGRTWAVRDVDLEVREGEILALLGASGCGKTTTLKLINRLEEPTSGRVLVRGRDVAEVDPVALRRGIGYVFQEVGLFPHLDVAENVAIVPRLCGWSDERIAARTRQLLELVGLDGDFARRRPAELSGGQAQRVGVARALAAEPGILLMDEPFGALDPVTRDRLQADFHELCRRLGLTVVLVTHDMTEALLLADRVAVMAAGRIVALDAPAGLAREPGHAAARELIDTPRRQAERLHDLMEGGG